MIQVDDDTCVLCGLCTGVCPPDALDLTADRLLVRPHCSGCGWCIPYCPVGALSLPPGAQPRGGRRS